jgi:hypothetical protein
MYTSWVHTWAWTSLSPRVQSVDLRRLHHVVCQVWKDKLPMVHWWSDRSGHGTSYIFTISSRAKSTNISPDMCLRMFCAGINDDEDAITPAPSLIQTESEPSIHSLGLRRLSEESGLEIKFPPQRALVDRAVTEDNSQQTPKDSVQLASKPLIDKSTMTVSPPNSPNDETSGPKAKAWPSFHIPKLFPLTHLNKHNDLHGAAESGGPSTDTEGIPSQPSEPVATRKTPGYDSKGGSVYPWTKLLRKLSDSTYKSKHPHVDSNVDDTFDMSGAASPQPQSSGTASGKRRPSLKGILVRKSSDGGREC